MIIDIKWQYSIRPHSKGSCIWQVVKECIEEVVMFVYGYSNVVARLGWAGIRG